MTATNFFTAGNFVNVILQMAGVTMIAYGVVFVLLLGEIDLSVAYLSGIAAVVAAQMQDPGGRNYAGWLAILIALAVVAVIGTARGSIVAKIGVPSFVVTLAGLLIWQGVILKALGESQGVIIIETNWINYAATYYFSAHGRLDHRGDHHRPLRPHRTRGSVRPAPCRTVGESVAGVREARRRRRGLLRTV